MTNVNAGSAPQARVAVANLSLHHRLVPSSRVPGAPMRLALTYLGICLCASVAACYLRADLLTTEQVAGNRPSIRNRYKSLNRGTGDKYAALMVRRSAARAKEA